MRTPIVTALAVLVAGPLFAQTARVEPGTPLRVSAGGHTLAGELLRWNADSLVLRLDEGGSPVDPRPERAFDAAGLGRVEALLPRSRARGAGRGALWGGLVGGLIGGVALAADDCYTNSAFLCPSSRMEGFLIGGAVIGGLGAGVGALIGVLAPGERWTPVSQGSTIAVAPREATQRAIASSASPSAISISSPPIARK